MEQKECSILSYSAGSTSLEPNGYRRIDSDLNQHLNRLIRTFPELEAIAALDPFFVNAYPASVGMPAGRTLIDTYLHPNTFVRAFRLAESERRNVVLLAQPVVAGELLMFYESLEYPWPSSLLLVSGGYYFPNSLEQFLKAIGHSRACQIQVLHSYGAAEINHTCFAGIDRFSNGRPRFRKILTEVDARIEADGELNLAYGCRNLLTGDFAEQHGNDWDIRNGSKRLSAKIRDELERWDSLDWARRTGKMSRRSGELIFQLRRHVCSGGANECRFYAFYDQFGGSFTAKPIWHDPIKTG